MLGLECATHRNLSKSIQNQTESLGEAPAGLLVISAPYGRKLFKNLIQKLIALRAEIIWAKPLRDFLFLGSLFEREIYQNRFKIKQNLDVRLKAYLYFGSLFEREITQKLNSKLIALRAEIGTYAYGILMFGVA